MHQTKFRLRKEMKKRYPEYYINHITQVTYMTISFFWKCHVKFPARPQRMTMHYVHDRDLKTQKYKSVDCIRIRAKRTAVERGKKG